jgi:bifunctional enzyme CysN/CysC
MSEDELLPGRGYWMKIGAQMVTAMVQEPKYEINVNTLDHLAAKTLDLNSVGVAELSTDREITFEPYRAERSSPNRAGRLHPDRQGDQRDGRCRDAPLRASPGA